MCVWGWWGACPFSPLQTSLKPPGPCPPSYLVDEGHKTVIETLDLLLLVPFHPLHCRVNFQVERHQQALIDGDRRYAVGRSTGRPDPVPKTRQATSGGHPGPSVAHITQAPGTQAAQGTETSTTTGPAGPPARGGVGDRPGEHS